VVQRGHKGLRASWADAHQQLAREQEVFDPAPEEERICGGDENNPLYIGPGQWPGAPADRLPPKCPVIPLGVDGKTTYFVDTLGQLIAVGSSEWSKKMLVQLFALQPNYLYWAWPRWSAPKKGPGGRASQINGLEVDDAVQCLLKAAAKRGLFTPMDRVRGRGAWMNASRELIWHAGDGLYRVEGKRLTWSRAGEIDGIFYPQRPPVTAPWQEPVDPTDSPAHRIFKALKTWNWERRIVDPLFVLGAIGCQFLGGALEFRPHLFCVGDKGVGKSTLQALVKSVIGSALHTSADTTPAGIYQRVKSDCLPVAIDELEASADNRRVMGVVALARLASSGAIMFRGGAEHEGVEFQLRNSFFFAAINPPPMTAAERTRMAFVNLSRVDPNAKKDAIAIINEDADGRMILRALMDAWPGFHKRLADWHGALASAGLDQRARDTYGTLLCVANCLLGDEAMEAAGLPLTEEQRLGEVIARETEADRAAATDNWRDCLEFLLGSTIEAWRGGEKPTIGTTIERWEQGIDQIEADNNGGVNHKLALVGLKGREELDVTNGVKRRLLCVPIAGSLGLTKLFAESTWRGGVWASALKQAPGEIVIRDRGNGQNVKINRVTVRCLLVDLAAYDAQVGKGE
jgi:hypothetical protein